MKFVLLLFSSLFNYAYSYDLCSVQDNLCSDRHVLDNCKVKSMNFDSRDCSQISFAGNDDEFNSRSQHLILQLQHEAETQLFLNLSFIHVKWKKAYLRLSDYNNKNTANVCKMYTVEHEDKLPPRAELYDSCLWNTAKKIRGNPFSLEYRAESKQHNTYKKLLFEMPDPSNFNDALPVTNRSIFTYVDFTNSQEIVLIIQPLPNLYNVARYKVEVFRERDRIKEFLLSDVLNITSKMDGVLTYNYTSTEEGHYFFVVSAINNGWKTTSVKVYISRKGTPLVIGIVGASFIIPFVLFIFHMWNRRFKPPGGLPDTVEKILILFKPSSDKHNDVVTTLAKTVKHLTGIEVMSDPVNLTKTKPKNADKWCSDNLIVATYIIYIAPPENDENRCELDYMTYNFLKSETKKSIPEKNIMILKFPYSTSDVPTILVNCAKFELMGDFQKFLNVFHQPVLADCNYDNNINCMELEKKIKLAQAETFMFKNKDTPKIIVTDQSEPSDEPNEIDVLL